MNTFSVKRAKPLRDSSSYSMHVHDYLLFLLSSSRHWNVVCRFQNRLDEFAFFFFFCYFEQEDKKDRRHDVMQRMYFVLFNLFTGFLFHAPAAAIRRMIHIRIRISGRQSENVCVWRDGCTRIAILIWSRPRPPLLHVFYLYV